MILLSLLLKTYTCQDFTKDGLDVVPFVDRFILSVHVWSPCPVRFAEKISRNTVPANLLWEKNIIPAEKNKLKKTNYKRSEHGPCAVKIRFSDCIWWLVQYKGAEQSVQNCTNISSLNVHRSYDTSCAQQPGEWWAAESQIMAAPAVDLGRAML